MRLIHVSDLHFGPHYMDAVGALLLETVAKLRPDAMVVTGDLTHRARHREFAAAAAFLEKARALVERIVVCPGNHDVALYRVWERLVSPFARYQQHIHPELDRVEQLPGATIVALNSVRPYSRLVQGHLNRRQLAFCQRAFQQSQDENLRILAVHHPIGMADQGFHHPSLEPNWQELCGEARLDIILTGHVHEAAVVPLQPHASCAPLILVSCGTTTSSRGRGATDSLNNFHVLEGTKEELMIESYRWHSDGGFQVFARHDFPRKHGHFVLEGLGKADSFRSGGAMS